MEALSADVEYDRALDKALLILTPRARSRSELRERLRRSGFGEDVVSRVEERLAELRIIDDVEFAHLWASSADARGYAWARIRAELEAKGVDRGDVDAAMCDLESETESEKALALARRRSLTYGGFTYEKAFRRLAGLLAARGYEVETIFEVCRRVLGEPPEPI